MSNEYQYSPQRFNALPPAVKNIIIINVIVFIFGWILFKKGIVDINDYFGLHLYASSYHHVWQYITYAFLHGGVTHLLFNMFAFWMFGSVLENVWGRKRFLLYCLVAALGAAIAQQITYYFMYHDFVAEVERIASSPTALINLNNQIMPKADALSLLKSQINSINTIGASGIVFGVLLAYGIMFPNTYVYFYFLVPIKTKWFVLGYCLLELFYGVSGTADGVAHFAHLGGALAGLLLILYWNKGFKRRSY
ncbi:MAG: rhomboid family intramembrane serine protease [Bacteroidales bacterium]|jgi:membrane associated rhomboid family serine protease|nr:rhomboid family intramembrane serine protease [Bacteroidales bacterium]